MADYYTQFSEALLIENDEQERWLKDLFEEGERFNEGKETDLEKWVFFDKKWGIEGFDGDWSWPGFEYEFCGDGTQKYLWVRSDTSANVQNVAVIIQAFLRRFRPDGVFRLTWANTCSKMRIGDFGGGGILVTAKNITWFDADGMIDRYLKRYHKGKVGLNT